MVHAPDRGTGPHPGVQATSKNPDRHEGSCLFIVNLQLLSLHTQALDEERPFEFQVVLLYFFEQRHPLLCAFQPFVHDLLRHVKRVDKCQRLCSIFLNSGHYPGRFVQCLVQKFPGNPPLVVIVGLAHASADELLPEPDCAPFLLLREVCDHLLAGNVRAELLKQVVIRHPERAALVAKLEQAMLGFALRVGLVGDHGEVVAPELGVLKADKLEVCDPFLGKSGPQAHQRLGHLIRLDHMLHSNGHVLQVRVAGGSAAVACHLLLDVDVWGTEELGQVLVPRGLHGPVAVEVPQAFVFLKGLEKLVVDTVSNLVVVVKQRLHRPLVEEVLDQVPVLVLGAEHFHSSRYRTGTALGLGKALETA
mmetsp:Transcript_21611/g.33810  ORF Transcript_21611/g.33810 Transcript_21611/m.33810 type:complete len:363 (+) Transcript_21611:213-1301(+)